MLLVQSDKCKHHVNVESYKLRFGIWTLLIDIRAKLLPCTIKASTVAERESSSELLYVEKIKGTITRAH